MAKFRQGHLNLLLATHVGAEGLDFGCCGLVVLLDPPTNGRDWGRCLSGHEELSMPSFAVLWVARRPAHVLCPPHALRIVEMKMHK
eukprot:1162113-Pelagomonas_calceolata.AAC.7